MKLKFENDDERLVWIHVIAAAVQSYVIAAAVQSEENEVTIQDAAEVADEAIVEYRKRNKVESYSDEDSTMWKDPEE